MRKSFILILMLSQFMANCQNTAIVDSNIFEKELSAFVEDPEMANASISLYAVNISKNTTIASYDEKRSIVPASTLKLLTTATALDVFGGEHCFKTYLEYDGEIKDSVLNGNIYIKGGGDPALGSALFKKIYYEPDFVDMWVRKIKELGVNSITGTVIGDARIFEYDMIPSTWIWGDIGNYYGAAPNGLTVYDSYYKIHFKTGVNDGDKTQIVGVEPEIPEIEFVNKVESSSVNRDRAYIYGYPYHNRRVVTGTLPKNRKDFVIKGSIPDPAYLISSQLSERLTQNGIEVNQKATTVRKLLWDGQEINENRKRIDTICSPALKDIIYYTNLKSVNIYAEHLLCHIGLKLKDTPDVNAGTNALADYWNNKNIDVEGMHLNDGSGLSRYNAVNSKHLVDVLCAMYHSKNYKSFLKSLPVAGESGSLRRMFKGVEVEHKLKAKSGYMTRVRGYSGYIEKDNGEVVAFSFLLNNYNCTPKEARVKMERVMNSLILIP